jgi:hypothetical protein
LRGSAAKTPAARVLFPAEAEVVVHGINCRPPGSYPGADHLMDFRVAAADGR